MESAKQVLLNTIKMLSARIDTLISYAQECKVGSRERASIVEEINQYAIAISHLASAVEKV